MGEMLYFGNTSILRVEEYSHPPRFPPASLEARTSPLELKVAYEYVC